MRSRASVFEEGLAGTEERVKMAHQLLAMAQRGDMQLLLEHVFGEAQQAFACHLLVHKGSCVLRKPCAFTKCPSKVRPCNT